MTALTEEQQGDADLEAGFAKTPPPATEKPVVVEVKTEAPPDQKPDEKPPEPVVEYVQLTKEEHGRLLALVDRTTEWQTKLDRALGTVGGMNEIIKKLQTATPKQVKIFLAKTRENYPDLADSIEADLEEGMKSAPAAEPVVEEPKKTEEDKPAEKSVAVQLQEQRAKDNMDMLDEAFPEWKGVVGFGLSAEEKAKRPYRIWLASKDEATQNRINNSQSALTIGRSIDEFNAYTRRQAALAKQRGPIPPKAPDSKIVARQDRIAESVQPRGDARPPPRKDSSQDDFEKGFHGS